MRKLVITPKNLKAALCFAGKQDVRYYLNGVLIEVSEAGALLLVATTGHAMLVIEEAFNPMAGKARQWILTRAEAEALAKSPVPVVLCEDADSRLTYEDGRGVPVIEGRFPEWRRVMLPKPDTETAAVYNPEHLAAVYKAAKALGTGAFRIYQNGDRAAPIAFPFGTGASGVIMPVPRPDDMSLAPVPAR